jgi:hypothetical protein
MPSASKVMETVFWVAERCKLVDFLLKAETINVTHYVQMLNKL